MTDLTPSEREIYIREYAALAGLDEDNRRSWAERAVGLERGKKSGYCAGDRKRGPKPRVPPKGSPELGAEARRLACLACAVVVIPLAVAAAPNDQDAEDVGGGW